MEISNKMEKITKVHIHVALSQDFQKAVQKYVTKATKSISIC